MKIAILLLTLSPLACILDNGYGTACAQDLTNEIGYECEDDEYGTYISIVPCDYVPSCRTQCPNCGERMDCDEFEGHVWSCYYYCGFCGQSMTFDESISHNCLGTGMGPTPGERRTEEVALEEAKWAVSAQAGVGIADLHGGHTI